MAMKKKNEAEKEEEEEKKRMMMMMMMMMICCKIKSEMLYLVQQLLAFVASLAFMLSSLLFWCELFERVYCFTFCTKGILNSAVTYFKKWNDMHDLTIVLIVFISCSCGKPLCKHVLRGCYSGVGKPTVQRGSELWTEQWCTETVQSVLCGTLTFRHRASCILGQAFPYSPENAFYIFNQQIYFIIWYLLDRASLI